MGSKSIEITDEEENLPFSEARDLLDVAYVVNALMRTDGNVSHAAQELGIGRRTIYDIMDKHGISCADRKLSIELKPFLRHAELRAPLLERYLE